MMRFFHTRRQWLCPMSSLPGLPVQRKQALQIAGAYEDEEIRNKIYNAFPTLGIVAFSGHVLDQPGSVPRFPPEAEEIAKKEIVEAIGRNECNLWVQLSCLWDGYYYFWKR